MQVVNRLLNASHEFSSTSRKIKTTYIAIPQTRGLYADIQPKLYDFV